MVEKEIAVRKKRLGAAYWDQICSDRGTENMKEFLRSKFVCELTGSERPLKIWSTAKDSLDFENGDPTLTVLNREEFEALKSAIRDLIVSLQQTTGTRWSERDIATMYHLLITRSNTTFPRWIEANGEGRISDSDLNAAAAGTLAAILAEYEKTGVLPSK